MYVMAIIQLFLKQFLMSQMTCRVWSKFQATRSDGSVVKLRIQDLPEDRRDDAVELFTKYFIHEEIFNKASGVARSGEAIADSRLIFTEAMKDPAVLYTICCEDKDDGEVRQIVGVSGMELIVAGSNPPVGIKVATKEVQLFFKLLHTIANLYDPLKELKVSRYFDDRGIVVHPQFRRLGIASELFKARHMACVAYDVPVTAALMTNIATEKMAEKHNWETVLEVSLDKLGQQHGVTFEDPGVRKLMIWRQPQ